MEKTGNLYLALTAIESVVDEKGNAAVKIPPKSPQVPQAVKNKRAHRSQRNRDSGPVPQLDLSGIKEGPTYGSRAEERHEIPQFRGKAGSTEAAQESKSDSVVKAKVEEGGEGMEEIAGPSSSSAAMEKTAQPSRRRRLLSRLGFGRSGRSSFFSSANKVDKKAGILKSGKGAGRLAEDKGKVLDVTPGIVDTKAKRSEKESVIVDPRGMDMLDAGSSSKSSQLKLAEATGVGDYEELMDILGEREKSKSINLQSSLVSLNTRIFDGGPGKVKEGEMQQLAEDLGKQSENVSLAIFKTIITGNASYDDVDALRSLSSHFDELASIMQKIGPRENGLSDAEKEALKSQLEQLSQKATENQAKLPNNPMELKVAALVTSLSCKKLLNTWHQVG